MGSFIPLQAVPNQAFAVPLDNQNCQLIVYQKTTGLFIDVFVDGLPIILSVICEDRNRIVRNIYLGFRGDLAFIDTQGASDPEYAGLGGRYQLLYIEPTELPEGAG